MEMILAPWPWWVTGPLIGLVVPALLVVGGKSFGLSENLRHMCSATLPAGIDLFRYDWRAAGSWNLAMLSGITVGAFVAVRLLGAGGEAVALSESTVAQLTSLGVDHNAGLFPVGLFSWTALASVRGVLFLLVGGFLVGFGSRYAGGCTSGHAIMGLANFQLPSLIAVVGFFAGGLLVTHGILPLLLRGVG
jgi:uncharacterized protein